MKYFKAFELVDPDTYARFGERSLQFFRPEALRMLDGVREFLGVPCIVNDWKSGGQYRFSGLRPRSCAIGAEYSAHRFGCAFDVKPRGMTIAAAWAKIQGAKGDPRIALIRRVEDISYTPTWLHVDTYEHDGDGILVVKP
jgi:hypothetical protein